MTTPSKRVGTYTLVISVIALVAVAGVGFYMWTTISDINDELAFLRRAVIRTEWHEFGLEKVLKAREQGVVVFYSNFPGETTPNEVEDFEDLFGIRVEYTISGTGYWTARCLTEYAAGSYEFDIVSLAGIPAHEKLIEAGVTRPYSSDFTEQIIDRVEFKDSEGYYHAPAVYGGSLLYNTDLVAEEELPTSWQDLLDPKWKGKIGILNPSISGTGFGFTSTFAQPGSFGWDYWRGIAENDPFIAASSGLLKEAMIRGECVVALDASIYASAAIAAGEPVKTAPIPEVGFIVGMSAAIAENAPHPEAAELFMDFHLSKYGEKHMMAEYSGYWSTRPGADPPPGFLPLEDYEILETNLEWQSLNREEILATFNEIMGL